MIIDRNTNLNPPRKINPNMPTPALDLDKIAKANPHKSPPWIEGLEVGSPEFVKAVQDHDAQRRREMIETGVPNLPGYFWTIAYGDQ